MPADSLGHAEAPERRGSPFTPCGLEFRTVIGQRFAHVMQQQVGIRADHLVSEFRLGRLASREFRDVTALATRAVEQRLARQDLRVVHVASSRYAQVA